MAVKLENANKSPVSGLRWWKEVGWKHIVALVMIAICAFPLLYVMSASFNPGGTLTGSIRLFEKISPRTTRPCWGSPFPRWMLHSFIVATATAIGTVLMAAAAAYAFSRFRFKGRRGSCWTRRLHHPDVLPQTLAFVAIFLLLLTIGDIFRCPASGRCWP